MTTELQQELGILRRMNVALEERGWTQHAYSDDNGAVCIVGAYLLAVGCEAELMDGFEEEDEFDGMLKDFPTTLQARLIAHAPRRLIEADHPNPMLGDANLAVSYNDDAFTTEEDVKLLVKRSIEDLERVMPEPLFND